LENDGINEISSEEDESTNENENQVQITRSGRVARPPDRLNLYQHHLFTQGMQKTEYNVETAPVIAKTMHYFNNLVVSKNYAFLETFSLKKGFKQFGQKGYDAALGEIKQLHDRVVFKPIIVKDLSQQEKKRAMESLIFLVEKRDARFALMVAHSLNTSTKKMQLVQQQQRNQFY
jgi:hypothetical protein